MTDPGERYLELALEEVVGGRVPPDLEDRILAVSMRRPRALLPGPWTRLAAASMLAAVALGGSLLLRSTPAPEPGPGVADRTPAPPVAILTARERARLDEWLPRLHESVNGLNLIIPENREKTERVNEAHLGVRDLLLKKPEAFAVVRPALEPVPTDPAKSDVTFRLLGLMMEGPHPSRDPAVLAWTNEHPERTSPAWLLCLAEDGYGPGEELLAERFAPAEPVYVLQEPAIYFGLRANPLGRAELDYLLANGWQERFRRPKFAGAAAAKLRLGEPVPWRDAVAHARAEVERAAAGGSADTARILVANLLYFHPAVAGDRIPTVRALDRRVAAFAEARAAELETVDQLRAALAAMD